MEESKMTLNVNEKPPVAKWLILSLQHVFAMFGATILVPILVNSAAGAEVLPIPVALVASGIGTLIYILCTKGKSPVYLGSSFAFIVPIAAAYAKGGIAGAMTGVIAVGIIYVIVSLIIRFVGKNWLDRLLPPVVIGPMIMIIGLGLAPSAISQIGITADAVLEWKPLVVALVSFLVTAIVMTRAKGFLRIIPFLVGIVSGYICACIFGIVDFDPVMEASFFSIPHFVFPFISYTPSFASLITIAPIALVTLCEHIGDHISLSNIIGKDLIKDPGLDKTLLGDGIATIAAGLIGGPANTTYGENTSVVGLTKVASVWVIGLAAIMAIVIGFLGKFTALVSTIPNEVLGGVSLLLYGFIGINGLKVLIKNQTDFENPKNVIVASSMLVLGLGGAVIAINSGDLSVTISGMSLAAIVGIILNLFLPSRKEENEAVLEVISSSDIKVDTKKSTKQDSVKEPKKETKKTVSKSNKKSTAKTKSAAKKETTKKVKGDTEKKTKSTPKKKTSTKSKTSKSTKK